MSKNAQETLQRIRESLRKLVTALPSNKNKAFEQYAQTNAINPKHSFKMQNSESSTATGQTGLINEKNRQEIANRDQNKPIFVFKKPHHNQLNGCGLNFHQNFKIKLQDFTSKPTQNHVNLKFPLLQKQNNTSKQNKMRISKQQIFEQQMSDQLYQKNEKQCIQSLEQPLSSKPGQQVLIRTKKRQCRKMGQSKLDILILKNKHLLESVNFQMKKVVKQFSAIPTIYRACDGSPKQHYVKKIQKKVDKIKGFTQKMQNLLASKQYTHLEMAKKMGVTKHSIQRYSRIFRENGGIIPIKYTNKNKTQKTLSQIKMMAVWKIISEKPDIQSFKVVQIVKEQYGIPIPQGLVKRIVNFLRGKNLIKTTMMNLSFKEAVINPIFNSQQKIEQRHLYAKKFSEEIMQRNLLQNVLFIQQMVLIEDNLKQFVQEYIRQSSKQSSRVGRAMIQNYLKEDQKLHDSNRTNITNLSKYSLMAVLSSQQLLQCNAIKGTGKFIQEHVCSQKYQGCVAVVPNLQKFTSKTVQKIMEQNNVVQMVLPNHYGDLNPMRKMFMQVKSNLIRKMIRCAEKGEEYEFPALLQQVVIDLDGNQVAPFISNMKMYLEKALRRERFE